VPRLTVGRRVPRALLVPDFAEPVLLLLAVGREPLITQRQRYPCLRLSLCLSAVIQDSV